MDIARLKIENFRGVKNGELLFNGHTVLVGDNNVGKSTVLEAIDLVLGPERLARRPVIDEHDFFAGEYLDSDKNPIKIRIEVVIIRLSEEQERHFKDHLMFWDVETHEFVDSPPPEQTNKKSVVAALPVGFEGFYDPEEDDFDGKTFFLSPASLDSEEFAVFRTRDKRECGFLILRTLRTGSRALSLERGSLLDIILRLQEKRLHMWEDVLTQLKDVSVAENPELGISDTLHQVQESLRSLVPNEWGGNPHIKVSDLTREHLRRTLTVFMDTGISTNSGQPYSAPFQHQGTGTINTLVLSLLSMIANLKGNVIFAMEEPEIALPPHTQKRVIESIKNLSAQSIFTSHSPYILEEFSPKNLLVLQRNDGEVTGHPCTLPPNVKPKTYKEEMRRRFCEALLSNRVLIAEGRTEYDAWPTASKKLHEFNPEKYKTLSNLGISVLNAETDSQVAQLSKFLIGIGKVVFAVFDKQDDENKGEIASTGIIAFESPEKGFENLILKQASEVSLQRFAMCVSQKDMWPNHLKHCCPEKSDSIETIRKSLLEYFIWGKGSGTAAEFIFQCENEAEIPEFIRNTLSDITQKISPTVIQEDEHRSTAPTELHDNDFQPFQK